MRDALDGTHARAYLLGTLEDERMQTIERGYFDDPEMLDAIDAAEESLIEDYLSGGLGEGDRTQFERHYLASPVHRTRMETVRRLAGHGRRQVSSTAGRQRLLAVAAVLVAMVGAGIWLVDQASRGGEPDGAPSVAGGSFTPARTIAPVVFAFTLAPLAVRGAADTPALVIPAGTNLVRLQFAGDGVAAPIAHGRAVIRTVSGTDIWQGILDTAPLPAGMIAAADAPADSLQPEDYIVTLIETTGAGDSEKGRYFLQVRRGG